MQISTTPWTLERKHYLPQCRVILHKLVPRKKEDEGVAGGANAHVAHIGVKNTARADVAAARAAHVGVKNVVRDAAAVKSHYDDFQ